MRIIRCACLTVFAYCAAYAQPGSASPAFDAVSVKPAPPPTPAIRNHIKTGGPGTADPGRVDWWSVSMLGFLMEAYDLKPYQISGPDWLSTEKFALTATVPKGATKEQYRLMLQRVLKERFKMQVHFDKKEGVLYSLVVGKAGPNMKESADAPPTVDPPADPSIPPKAQKDSDGFPVYPQVRGLYDTALNGRARLHGQQVTMERFAATLTNRLGHTVKDETGLKGKYDFFLTYAPNASTLSDSEPGPDLIDALPQIGLKLEQKKGMIDMLVIDHLEKVPTEN